MTSTNSRKSRHRQRTRTTILALVATAALTGGAQAVGPASTIAAVNQGAACSGSFWIDQFICSDRGDGGGSGGAGSVGAGPSGGKGEQLPHETVVVVDPAKKPKAPVGGTPQEPLPDPERRPSREEGKRAGGRSSGSSKSEPAGYKCLIYDEHLVFDSQAACDQMREKAYKERKATCGELQDELRGFLQLPKYEWDHMTEWGVRRVFRVSEMMSARNCGEFEKKRPG